MMKRYSLNFIASLVLLFYTALQVNGQKTDFQGKVIDAVTSTPMPNVVITDVNKVFAYGASDSLGVFRLSSESLPDSVQFVSMGYKTRVFARTQIPKELVLVPDSLIIEEIVVSGISTKKIVQKAADVWRGSYRSAPYLAQGVYTKTTQSNNQYIEFFQGMGYLAASGYTQPKKWDNLHSYFHFAPMNARASYSYAKAGASYKLEAKLTDRYNTGNREVFQAFRALEAYGPLAPAKGLLAPAPHKHYTFRLDSVVHHPAKTYVVRFETKPGAVGNKLRIEGRGWMWIDAKTFTIQRYQLDNLNYLYVPFCNRKRLALPYLAQMDISFQLFEDELFPHRINLLKVWKHNNTDDIYASFPPSRLHPGSNHLVVNEQFVLQQITRNSLVYDNVSVARIIKLAATNPRIYYDKVFWSRTMDNPGNWDKIIKDLSIDVPLARQFLNQHATYYYDFGELPAGQYGTSKRRKEVIDSIWQDKGWLNLLEKRLSAVTRK